MSDPSRRDRHEELISWPEPLAEQVSIDGSTAPSQPKSAMRKREPGEALVLAEAALVAARNEIALLRARVERLTLANEALETELRELRDGR
jgi:hypothetical protein